MKNITLLTLVLLLIQVFIRAQPFLPEGITFTTQEQIDSFHINQIGQVIEKFIGQSDHIGINEVLWQAEGLPPGIYFIRLQVNNDLITKKIIKSSKK